MYNCKEKSLLSYGRALLSLLSFICYYTERTMIHYPAHVENLYLYENMSARLSLRLFAAVLRPVLLVSVMAIPICD